jgi:hypothetical protein
VLHLLHVTLLAPRVLKSLLDFFEGVGDFFIPAFISFIIANVIVDVNFNSCFAKVLSHFPLVQQSYVWHLLYQTIFWNTACLGYITTQFSYIIYDESL